MDKPKLLIVDYQEEFRSSLADMLRDFCQIRQAGNGEEAIKLLEEFLPDVMVLDLFLPEVDGVSLMHWAKQKKLAPSILVVTRLINDYVERSLTDLKVDYVMCKPCSLRAATERVKDLCRKKQDRAQADAMARTQTVCFLRDLQFPSKLDGYDYLCNAIPIYACNPRQALTKELYCAVGETCDASAAQVERSIRNAIRIAWERRKEDMWQQYFSPDQDGTFHCPTNKEVISSLAGCLMVKMAERKEE